MISESPLQRATAADGRILRDRVLSDFGVRLNARKRTFMIAPYWEQSVPHDAGLRVSEELGSGEFSEHCHAFAQSKGSALIEVGRGAITFRVGTYPCNVNLHCKLTLHFKTD